MQELVLIILQWLFLFLLPLDKMDGIFILKPEEYLYSASKCLYVFEFLCLIQNKSFTKMNMVCSKAELILVKWFDCNSILLDST